MPDPAVLAARSRPLQMLTVGPDQARVALTHAIHLNEHPPIAQDAVARRLSEWP
jgi:hypothetical protein